jgi:cytochrome P450 family 142 subfamily A polypeptide 1
MLASISGDPERLPAAATAFTEYHAYAMRMIADRRTQPRDDLVSLLVHAEVDGDRLADHELVFESLLLLLGGDETTRHVITGGVNQLLRHPAEKQRLLDDLALLATSVEEMLRWVSPIKNMNRTVTRDTELEGAQLRAGDRILVLYESANFDESRFDQPDRFDVGRVPNEHLAFGFGEHFCLGASIARLEVRSMVGRLLGRLPDLDFAGEAPPARFMDTITSLPVHFTPAPRADR